MKNNSRIIISYGRKHRLPPGDYLPVGFSEYLIDSGGFQLAVGTAERTISVGGYTLFLQLALERHGDVIKGYMGLDTKDWLESLHNYDYMRKKGLTPIPVWKAFWPESVLDLLCNEYDWVAMGGIAFTASKAVLRHAWERVAIMYPKTKIHLLGVGVRATSVFRTWRPYSIDVSTWGAPARYGADIIWTKNLMLKEQTLPDAERQKLRDNEAYERQLIDKAIGTLNSLETVLDDLKDPYQSDMFTKCQISDEDLVLDRR